MRTIFAEYNPQCNSIDVYTNTGYIPVFFFGKKKKKLKNTT